MSEHNSPRTTSTSTVGGRTVLATHDRRLQRDVASWERLALEAGSTVHLYPGASHAVNGEEPDRITADITDFLAERD